MILKLALLIKLLKIMNIRAFLNACRWGILIGVGAGVFSSGILLGVGTIYAASTDARILRDVQLGASSSYVAPPVVVTPETTKDQQLERVIEELNRTKEDLRQTNAALKSLTDNISEHFISNYRDTITVVGAGIGIVAALLGGLMAWAYGLLKEGLTKKIKAETEEVHDGMMEESKSRLFYMIYTNLSHAFYLYYRALFVNTSHLGFKGGTDLAIWFAGRARENALMLRDGNEREERSISAGLHLQYHAACKALIPGSNIIKADVVSKTSNLYAKLTQIKGSKADLYSTETMAWVLITLGTEDEKAIGKTMLESVLTNPEITISYKKE